MGEGDLVLHGSFRPARPKPAARDRPDVSSLIVQISRARLPLHSNTLDRLT
ncbi:hypothetical protein ACWD25_29905 [Streptomyces sp. NPDC002920]